jgi:MerR family mercuric resistance operon transcriptional regulator
MTGATRLTIGKLAEQGGVNIQTIRYYERRGLLPEPRRSPAGYRLYDVDAVIRLGFISKAQRLGFSLNEIGELLLLRVRPETSCADVRERARGKIALVDTRIAELTRIRGALVKLVAQCRGRGPAGACPILENLATSGDGNG